MEGLIVESGPQQGLIVEIPGDGLTIIGRGEACDVQVEDDKVSREHAAVVKKGRKTLLRDLKSRNGTIIDDRFVREKPLEHGDVFRLGATRIRYTDCITEEDRALAAHGEVALTPHKRQTEIEIVYDQGQWSKYTYASLACLLLSVHWLFAVLALAFAIGALIEIKLRGDLAGTKPTLAALLVALAVCSFHGYTKVWQPMVDRFVQYKAGQVCQQNMRTIYRALNRYSIDQDGHYPGSLEALYPRYLKSADCLCCPCAREPIVLPNGFPTSYTYFGASASVQDPRAVLLMDHHPLNHQLKHASLGRYVLYVNGTVALVPEAQAVRILHDVKTRGEPAPEKP